TLGVNNSSFLGTSGDPKTQVTLASPIDLSSPNPSATLTVYNGLTVDTTMSVGAPNVGNGGGGSHLTFADAGTQTLRTDSAGTLVLGSSGSNTLSNTLGALVVAPGVTIRGQAGSIGVNDAVSKPMIVNQGTIWI